jgi:uncharacterized oxidoreductase
MVRIAADALQTFVRDIFLAAGCDEIESGAIAKGLVGANLAGHDSHGVVRVPRYLQWKAEGAFVPGRKVKVVRETPVLAVLDAEYGFGQTVAPQAVLLGVRKAQAMGLAVVALRNAGHIGRVGEWAEMAAEAGLVSVHFVNAAGSILVAPFGGAERRMSTAPFVVGVPRPGAEPIILDFATSLVAEGKVLVASQGGKPVPADALIDHDGTKSGDPHVLYGPYAAQGPRNYRDGKGAIRAFGEHKGSGLAFMCEILGGSLTGTGAAQEGRRWANGMLSFYIDPRQLDPGDFFSADVQRYVDYFRSARPAETGGEVLIPGEPELRARAQRLEKGVLLPDDTWAMIVKAAREAGVADAAIPRL